MKKLNPALRRDLLALADKHNVPINTIYVAALAMALEGDHGRKDALDYVDAVLTDPHDLSLIEGYHDDLAMVYTLLTGRTHK